MEVSVVHPVHLHPPSIFSVYLVVGCADAGELAQGDVIGPGGQALLLGLHLLQCMQVLLCAVLPFLSSFHAISMLPFFLFL